MTAIVSLGYTDNMADISFDNEVSLNSPTTASDGFLNRVVNTIFGSEFGRQIVVDLYVGGFRQAFYRGTAAAVAKVFPSKR